MVCRSSFPAVYISVAMLRDRSLEAKVVYCVGQIVGRHKCTPGKNIYLDAVEKILSGLWFELRALHLIFSVLASSEFVFKTPTISSRCGYFASSTPSITEKSATSPEGSLGCLFSTGGVQNVG